MACTSLTCTNGPDFRPDAHLATYRTMNLSSSQVRAYEPEVARIAAELRNPGESLDDLVQDAWVGVLEAPEAHTSITQAIKFAARNGIVDARRRRTGDERTPNGKTKRRGNRHTECFGTSDEDFHDYLHGDDDGTA